MAVWTAIGPSIKHFRGLWLSPRPKEIMHTALVRGFLLKQIAPQIHALQVESFTQHLLDAGVPTELLNQLTPYLTVGAKQLPAVDVLVGAVG